MRGRVQVEWRCANQTRANTQRDWLNLQLQGRGYIAEDIPVAELNPRLGVWVTRCNVAFNTLQDGSTIKTLCLSRQGADTFILAGSWTQYHECPHDDGLNTCAATLVRTVKP